MAGLTKIISGGIGPGTDLDGSGTLKLDSTNNRVGIGTDSPTHPLHIDSDVDQLRLSDGSGGFDIRAGNIFKISDDGTERMRIDGAGNLGINQTSVNATRKVEITQPSSYTSGLRVNSAGSSGNPALIEFFVGSSNYKIGGHHSTDQLKFMRNTAELMIIDSDGFVGINSTNPTTYLQVTGANTSARGQLTIAGSSGGAGVNARLTFYRGTDFIGHIQAGSDNMNIHAESGHYINFASNNSDAMRIDTSGRLLVGTSASVQDTYALQVVGSYTGTGGRRSALFRYGEASSNGPQIRFEKNRSNSGGTSSTQDDDHVGQILFYGTDQGGSYRQAAYIEANVDDTPANNTVPGRLRFLTTPTGTSQSPVERMRIANNGDITFGANLVNRASQNCTTFGGMTTFSDLDKDGAAFNNNGRFIGTQSSQGLTSIVLYQRGTATTQYMLEFFRKQVQSGGDNSYDFVGSITTNFSNTSYNTGSDYRLKENIIDLTGAIDRVKQLQPRRFNFIKDPGNTVDGFVAHEAQTVVPESITGTKDEVADFGNVLDESGVVIESDVRQPEELPEGKTWVKTETKPVYQAIDQSKLVPLLTAALQEAIAEIETLKTKVAALEAG